MMNPLENMHRIKDVRVREIVILSKARNLTNVRSIYSNTCTCTLDFKDWELRTGGGD